MAQIADNFATFDQKFEKTLVHVYSSANDLEMLANKVIGGLSMPFEHPLAVCIGTFDELKVVRFIDYKLVNEAKTLSIYNEAHEIKLPKVPLLTLASPIIVDDGVSRNSKARQVMSAFKSLAVSFFGVGFLLDQIAEFEVGAGDGKISHPTRAFRVLKDEDFRGILDPAAFDETMRMIAAQAEPARSQIYLACEFYSRGAEGFLEYRRFFDYWTSLEICGQGRSLKLKALLAKAYSVSVQYVDEELGFAEIIRMRHDLIHRGQLAQFERRIERRIQAVFLDILRQRLGLSCLRFVERLGA